MKEGKIYQDVSSSPGAKWFRPKHFPNICQAWSYRLEVTRPLRGEAVLTSLLKMISFTEFSSLRLQHGISPLALSYSPSQHLGSSEGLRKPREGSEECHVPLRLQVSKSGPGEIPTPASGKGTPSALRPLFYPESPVQSCHHKRVTRS